MAKNKKKVAPTKDQDVEHIVIVEPFNQRFVTLENHIVDDDTSKQVYTEDMDKAKELLQVAVNEVMEGVLPLGELLNIAKRKVRRTSVLTEEENEALDKLHVEVEVKY